MSVAVSRSEGVTVLTLTSNPSSVCPPLCQLLGALCYSPRLCSVSGRLLPQRGGPQTVLGALWIITGVLHIGLGSILLNDWSGSWYQLRDTSCPVWLGVLFMFFGVCCVLTERYPRVCFVLLSAILNLLGVALSITAIVWYASGLGYHHYYGSCPSEDYNRDTYGNTYRNRYRYRYRDEDWDRTTTTTTPPTPSPEHIALMERCQDKQDLLRNLSTSFSSILVILSVLDLCVGLSSAILSFKSLRRKKKGQSGTAE